MYIYTYIYMNVHIFVFKPTCTHIHPTSFYEICGQALGLPDYFSLTLSHTETHCHMLQHTANTLQHTATHCNTLRRFRWDLRTSTRIARLLRFSWVVSHSLALWCPAALSRKPWCYTPVCETWLILFGHDSFYVGHESFQMRLDSFYVRHDSSIFGVPHESCLI